MSIDGTRLPESIEHAMSRAIEALDDGDDMPVVLLDRLRKAVATELTAAESRGYERGAASAINADDDRPDTVSDNAVERFVQVRRDSTLNLWSVMFESGPGDFVVVYRSKSKKDAEMIGGSVQNILRTIADGLVSAERARCAMVARSYAKEQTDDVAQWAIPQAEQVAFANARAGAAQVIARRITADTAASDHVAALERLRGLVQALLDSLPQCDHPGCERVATRVDAWGDDGPNECEKHATGKVRDTDYTVPLRALIAALEDK